jgi:DGQHR domain-containing protein
LQDGLELWNVDGQHRYGGVMSAYETDGYTELESYPFPVVIMWEVDRIGEMQHFSTINTEQKKMPTDIVDRHLVTQLEKLGEDALVTSAKTTGQGQKNVMRALTTRVVDGLNSQGLWQKNITIPGDANNSKGLVRQHAMVVSLEPFMSDLGLGALDHQERITVINRYWDAIGQLCSEAIKSPQDYRLQATVGIYALHRALPAVAQVCQSKGGMKPEIIKAVLSETEDVFTSDFWSKNPEVGHPLTLGTGMGSIRALAQYIINRLPVKSGAVIL